MVEVPTVVSGDEVIHSKFFPKRWLEHKDRVESIHKQFSKRHIKRAGVQSISITSDETREFGGKLGFQIRVRANENLNGNAIPGTVSGINVTLSPANEAGLACSSNEVDDGDCLVNEDDGKVALGGGIKVDPSNGGYGTMTTSVYDQAGGEFRYLTAAHLFGPENTCGDSIDGVSMSYNGTTPGTVVRHNEAADFALVSPNGSFYTKNKIDIEERVESYPLTGCENVEGHVTETEVANMLNNEAETTYKMGCVTDTTDGWLTDYKLCNSWLSCIDFNCEGIRYNVDNAEGDSGSPVFKETSSGGVAMVALHQMYYNQWFGNTACNGKEYGEAGSGIAAYSLSNDFSITF